MPNLNNQKKSVIPIGLLHFCENINDPVGIKDIQSRLLYVNRAFLELHDMPRDFDVYGKLDDDLPTPLAEFGDKLRAHDALVMRLKDRKSALEIHEFGHNKVYGAFICDKMPLYSEHGDVNGTMFHAKRVKNIPTDIFADNNRKTGSILLYTPSNIFNELEWSVVFLLIRRFSRKEISNLLYKSLSRVDSLITSILDKAGINRGELTEFIRNNNWHNYVPEKFLRRGHTILS